MRTAIPPRRMQQAQRLLLALGAAPDFAYFHYTARAVCLALDCSAPLYVTKMLYPEVASYYHTTWAAVERGIRRLIASVWKKDPALFCRVTGYPLTSRPSPSRFIALLSACVSMTDGDPLSAASRHASSAEAAAAHSERLLKRP